MSSVSPINVWCTQEQFILADLFKAYFSRGKIHLPAPFCSGEQSSAVETNHSLKTEQVCSHYSQG